MVMKGWKEEITIEEQGNTQLLMEVIVSLNVEEPSRAGKDKWDREGVSSCLKGYTFNLLTWKSYEHSYYYNRNYGKPLKLPLTAQINKQCFSSQVTPWSDRPSTLVEIDLFCIRQHLGPGSWEPGMWSSCASFLCPRASNSQNSSSVHEWDLL